MIRRLVAFCLLAALVGVACGTTPTPSPSPAPTSPSPPPQPTPPGGCPVPTQTGSLPSNRVVDLEVVGVGGVDRMTFTFEPAADAPGGPARGTLRETVPPFHQGGSGELVEVDGERFIEIRFEAMTIADEDGNAVYRGPRELQPGGAVIREIAVVDAFEGVMAWIVGFDGPGCVVLGGDREAGIVTVDLQP